MPGKARKDPKKPKEIEERGEPEKKKRTRRERKPARAKEEKTSVTLELKATEIQEEIVLRGPVQGSPGFIQSTYGNKGNFEVVVPLAAEGLARYWRNNDDEMLPWYGPITFGAECGIFRGASLIQSNFGEMGNLELSALDVGGHNLMHFWCDSGPNFEWHGPNFVSENSLIPVFSGNPALIQSRFGGKGNFDLVVPRAEGGFSHYLRDNDDPALSWYGPFDFATDAGIFDAVTLIQSNFGELPGNFELVARSGDRLVFFWRESGGEFKWHGPFPIDTGVAGVPSMIQSNFGYRGNFEVVVPLASGGLAHYWRDNDDPHLHWYGPFMFGMNIGNVDAVSLIQSNFEEPGHLELVAQADGQLAFFWRDSGPDFRWNGPQFITI